MTAPVTFSDSSVTEAWKCAKLAFDFAFIAATITVGAVNRSW